MCISWYLFLCLMCVAGCDDSKRWWLVRWRWKLQEPSRCRGHRVRGRDIASVCWQCAAGKCALDVCYACRDDREYDRQCIDSVQGRRDVKRWGWWWLDVMQACSWTSIPLAVGVRGFAVFRGSVEWINCGDGRHSTVWLGASTAKSSLRCWWWSLPDNVDQLHWALPCPTPCRLCWPCHVEGTWPRNAASSPRNVSVPEPTSGLSSEGVFNADYDRTWSGGMCLQGLVCIDAYAGVVDERWFSVVCILSALC